MRRNVLVDLGPTTDLLGSELIITPDFYKRINSMGKIVSVGSGCKHIRPEDEGKTCTIGIEHDPDRRINPVDSKRMGLDPHWHFIMLEDDIQVRLDP